MYKVCNVSSTIFPKWVEETLENAPKTFDITYKQGKGHFKISLIMLLAGFNQNEFKKVVSMIADSEDPQTLAGYLNSFIKKLYDRFNTDDNKKLEGVDKILQWFIKRNEILVKAFNVSDLTAEKTENSPTTTLNETTENDPVESKLMTELKKCNVLRFIPTQVNPIWEFGLIKSYVGYHFEYRGLPLQVYREDGWETKNKKESHVFIIDPVIGLPVASYYGMLAELEDKLSEVFINYLQTIESNKESIVLIARAFEDLKRQTNNMTA